MTRGDDQAQVNVDTGDVANDGDDIEELSSTELSQMHSREGRGARQDQGAAPSDEYVDAHVDGDSAPGANKSKVKGNI